LKGGWLVKVLLTGGTGFIGRYVSAELAARAIPAVLLGRRPPSDAAHKYIPCDLLDPYAIGSAVRAAGASHLLHLAWYTEHGKYWESRENLRWLEATSHLVACFNDAGGRRSVIAGTCAEYDWSMGSCSEADTPLAPASLYGVAKDATRRLAEAMCRQDRTEIAWGRIFFNYGAGEPASRLVPSLIAALTGKSPPFSVDLTSRRDFLHAADIARGFVALLDAPVTGAVNISSGVATPVSGVVATLARLLGADPKPVFDLGAERPGQPREIMGVNGRLGTTGWRQELSLEQGLKHVLDGYA